MKKETLVTTKLIAHRGASAIRPENTLEAVEAAAQAGAKWIETDVQLTADGRLVMFHDYALERVTNGTGALYGKTLKELQALDAGSWMNPAFSHCRIPTLEHFIAVILEHNLCLQLELKPVVGTEERLTDRVLETLAKKWRGENNLFISSFVERALCYVNKHNTGIPLSLAVDVLPENIAERADSCGVSIIHFQCHLDYARSLEIMRANPDYEYGVATVNDVQTAQTLYNAGVDHILTDDPALFSILK